MQNDYLRKISTKLILKPLLRTGLSANKITVLNFLTLGLGSILLFLRGREVLGLLVACLAALIDYCDGTVSKIRTGGYSKLGSYLDTSLDWLWLQLLIYAISYHNDILHIGCLAIIAIMWGNWVEYNGFVKQKMHFPLGISHILLITIILRCSWLGIILLAITQWVRVISMYGRSVWKFLHA